MRAIGRSVPVVKGWVQKRRLKPSSNGTAGQLRNIRQLKTDQTELSFLTLEQIGQLLDEYRKSTNNHTYPVALICLATGARWDEAESLTRAAIFGGKAHFHRTKTENPGQCPYPGKSKTQLLRSRCLGLAACLYPAGLLFVVPMSAAGSRRQGS